MMIDPLVIGGFVLGGVLAFGVSYLLRYRRQSAEQAMARRQSLRRTGEAQAEFAIATEKAMLDLKTSVEGLATCMANLELRMRTVDQRQRKLDEQSARLMRRRGFDEAVSLARDGKPSDAIARRCGMPLAEVELLKRIQAQGLGH